MEIQLEGVVEYSGGNDPAVIAIGQNGKREILFGDKEEQSLLSIGCTPMRIRCDVTRFANEPGDAHQAACASIHLRHAHCAQAMAGDHVLLAVAHVEAPVLEQIMDDTYNTSYAVACSANCPRSRHLHLAFYLLVPNDEAVCE